TLSTLISWTIRPSTVLSWRSPSLFAHNLIPRPSSCRRVMVLSLFFNVQIWNAFGLSQPSRRTEC
ncbi:MAG: hypothetical protein LBE09_06150, partial [Christensenellaceae bacterium]|nr:hypothetical protein [Christensenellaceae bacterium]